MTHQLPQSCEGAGPSPDHKSMLRQRDALSQLQSGAAHLRNKVPLEAGTLDQPAAEDTDLPTRKTDQILLAAGSLRGYHRNSLHQRCVATLLPTTKRGAAPPRKGLHGAPDPPSPPGSERKRFQQGLTAVPRCSLLSCKEGAAAASQTPVNQARDEHSGTWFPVNDARLLHWCFVSLSALPACDGWVALPRQTFTWCVVLLSGLFWGGRYTDH